MKEQSANSITLGIDIGGTNTAFAAVDSDGTILKHGVIPTTGYPTFRDFIKTLYEEVSRTLLKAGIKLKDIKGIGVGAPCVNPYSGIIEGAVDLPWPSPLPLLEFMREYFQIPVFTENDANAAALGEAYYGAARGMDNFLMLTLGTGVGSAVVCDGHLLKGKNGLAGELGHHPVTPEGKERLCNCGRKNCLETFLSARGIVTTAKELLASEPTPSILRTDAHLDAGSIGKAADNGDPIALKTFRITGKVLGKACADFATFSSPEAFILFGGVANAYPHFFEEMKKSYEDNLLWIYKDQAQFLVSSLPSGDAALLGAAAVAKNYCL